MRVLTKDKYDEEVIELGGLLKKEDIIPDISKDRYFEENYKNKLDYHLEHTLKADCSSEFHLSHHMFILEVLVDTGYVVYGQGFETKFPEEYNNAKTMFELIRADCPSHADYYTKFRETASIDEKVDVMKRHHNLIRTEKETAKCIDNGVFKVVNDIGRHYKKSVKEQICLIASLIKGIDAEHYAEIAKQKK